MHGNRLGQSICTTDELIGKNGGHFEFQLTTFPAWSMLGQCSWTMASLSRGRFLNSNVSWVWVCLLELGMLKSIGHQNQSLVAMVKIYIQHWLQSF